MIYGSPSYITHAYMLSTFRSTFHYEGVSTFQCYAFCFLCKGTRPPATWFSSLHISNIAGFYDMPFAHLFQDMRGRTKRAGEYQDSEKKNTINERLGDKVQERDAIFRRENHHGYTYWFCAGYDFSYTVWKKCRAFCIEPCILYCFIRSLRKICMLSKWCLFRVMHFILSFADYKNQKGVLLCLGFPCGGI